ncbi:uncharacterized protein N7458_001762 [Penicillium daleae]|uniref:Uncharacterized protein n=1 Tax=Penicillium daleae TaxID=63821 RepID=A0AAD6G635_9EURO|nr:uncharacterized protein N7458_001762 [Penicillium daleae]KAJ5460210.1 hypothetical protein N7458_001762 [Penicillium daleae]
MANAHFHRLHQQYPPANSVFCIICENTPSVLCPHCSLPTRTHPRIFWCLPAPLALAKLHSYKSVQCCVSTVPALTWPPWAPSEDPLVCRNGEPVGKKRREKLAGPWPEPGGRLASRRDVLTASPRAGQAFHH